MIFLPDLPLVCLKVQLFSSIPTYSYLQPYYLGTLLKPNLYLSLHRRRALESRILSFPSACFGDLLLTDF